MRQLRRAQRCLPGVQGKIASATGDGEGEEMSDPLIDLCDQAQTVLNQMLLGECMGTGRSKVHDAFGDIAELIVEYTKAKKESGT
jgi:hypothetical protein